MGHPKTSLDHSADEQFVWTYTSPEFPMAQVCNFTSSMLASFQLNDFCFGNFLLLDMKQRYALLLKDALISFLTV